MENSLMIERIKFIKGLDPVADAFAGTVYSDSVSLAKYGRVAFIVYKGVGTTGTSTLTVECSSDASRTGATAVAFNYRRVATGDTGGSVTAAAAAGFDTTAGSSELYIVEVEASACPSGKPWVHLKAVEVVNDPVLGGILVLADDAKYHGSTLPTAIA